MLLTRSSFLKFVHEHDNLPVFQAGYLVLTFLAAAVFNLGFFGIIIVGHIALDIVKYRHIYQYSLIDTIKGALAESVFDVTLFAIACVFVVFLDHGYSIALFSGLVRTELTIVSMLGAGLPKMKILNDVLADWFHVRSYIHTPHYTAGQPLAQRHWWMLGIIAVCIASIFAAPVLMQYTDEEWNMIVRRALVPWRL